MKLITTITLLSVITLLACNCGLNEKDKTALLHEQQVKDDSIRVAEINQIKQSETLKSSLADSLASHIALLNRQQNFLIQLRAALYAANDQMTQIKTFHLGRLPADRDAQIKNQELVIQSFILQEENIQSVIQHNREDVDQLKAELKSAQ